MMKERYGSASVSETWTSRFSSVRPNIAASNQPPASANRRAPDRRHHELRDRFAGTDRMRRCQKLEEDDEERDRHSVIGQALALNQPCQPLRRAEIAEDGKHRARIGGGDHRADEQAGEQRHARKR